MSDIIVALDYTNAEDALKFVNTIDPAVCALKIGSVLYTAAGPDLVKQIVDRRFRVFLDLKYHDIPNTVAQSCKVAAELGVWMLNVHASGGEKMMRAAKGALEPYGNSRPLLIAVTVLTSMDNADLATLCVANTLEEQVKKMAAMAYAAGLDGVVCSAHEVHLIDAEINDPRFLKVTPGIRLEKGKSHDQKRIMTPEEARAAGSDYLVIGRSITQSINPIATLRDITKKG